MHHLEESLIRYERLGLKGYEASEIEKIQLLQVDWESFLGGPDAHIWGTAKEPASFAADIIQVLPTKTMSPLVKSLKDSIGPWWLQRYRPRIFGLASDPNKAGVYVHSYSTFESAAVHLVSTLTFTIISGALATLYLAPGRLPSLFVVLTCSGAVLLLNFWVLWNEAFVTALAA